MKWKKFFLKSDLRFSKVSFISIIHVSDVIIYGNDIAVGTRSPRGATEYRQVVKWAKRMKPLQQQQKYIECWRYDWTASCNLFCHPFGVSIQKHNNSRGFVLRTPPLPVISPPLRGLSQLLYYNLKSLQTVQLVCLIGHTRSYGSTEPTQGRHSE